MQHRHFFDLPSGVAQLPRFVAFGAIRLCPICDAYEITDKRVGLITRGAQTGKHALFLRNYTAHLTLIRTDPETPMPDEERAALRDAGVTLIEDAQPHVSVDAAGVPHVALSDGHTLEFDSLYPMFGCHPRCELAARLDAECDDDGNPMVDTHQMTSVPGLYAAGDLVTGLNQISVAVCHAAVAATAIHNRAEQRFVASHAPLPAAQVPSPAADPGTTAAATTSVA